MIGRRRRNLHIIPSAIALLAPATFGVTYALAVIQRDVSAILPYVSATGTTGIQSCIFSFFLNITAFLLAACVYARHLFLKRFGRFRSPTGYSLNRIATTIGLISCFGLDMVGNFQVTKFFEAHYLGAGLCFLGGAVYFFMQTILSTHCEEEFEDRTLFYLRVFLTVLCFAFLASSVITGLLARSAFHGVESNYWGPTDGGYLYHVASAASEWLTVLTQCSLVLTFLPTFRCISIRHPKIYIEGISDPSSSAQLVTVSSSIIFG